jgi:hypothetical protein
MNLSNDVDKLILPWMILTSLGRNDGAEEQIEELHLHATQILSKVQFGELAKPDAQRSQELFLVPLPQLVEGILQNVLSTHAQQQIVCFCVRDLAWQRRAAHIGHCVGP